MNRLKADGPTVVFEPSRLERKLAELVDANGITTQAAWSAKVDALMSDASKRNAALGLLLKGLFRIVPPGVELYTLADPGDAD
jgi:hypothetical protein